MVMPCGKTRGHTWQATWTPDPTRPGHNTVPTTVDWPSIAIGRWLTGGPADVHGSLPPLTVTLVTAPMTFDWLRGTTQVVPRGTTNDWCQKCTWSEDKDEGKSHAGTLIDVPVFIKKNSIITGFTIIDGDDITNDVVLGMKFCKKYASCQMIMKKFALGDKCERIMDDE
ncbi:hypothetical protein Tco_0164052 [Tanacetum coccineum]